MSSSLQCRECIMYSATFVSSGYCQAQKTHPEHSDTCYLHADRNDGWEAAAHGYRHFIVGMFTLSDFTQQSEARWRESLSQARHVLDALKIALREMRKHDTALTKQKEETHA